MKRKILTVKNQAILYKKLKAYFEYWYSHFVEGLEVVQVEGRLCTEVSRGNGIVKNYIAIG